MPRKPCQYTPEEAALLHEARGFLAARADDLDAMRAASQELRERLEATHAYRRVDGHDYAEQDPIWALGGTLESVYEDELETLADTLRDVAREPVARLREGDSWQH